MKTNFLPRLLYVDNTQLNAGTGGDVIATDDIGGVKHQQVKMEFGIDGTATPVSAANPMPVTLGAIDNTSLYSNTLSAVGAITGIDTTGYKSVIAQLSGVWAGAIIVEGSNDNSTWQELMVMSLDELAMQDMITINGLYQLKTSCRYIRLNVMQYQSGSIVALLLGRTVAGISGADMITLAMDKANNTPLYVEDITGAPKKDKNNALVPSDAPAPIFAWCARVNDVPFNIDTTGYQSLVIQTIAIGSSLTISGSHDGVNWVAINGYNTVSATPASTITAAPNLYVIPAITRYIRAVATGGSSYDSMWVYLRQQPASTFFTSTGMPINIQSIGGNAATSSAVTGSLAIGGSVANGGAASSSTNPVVLGGVDSATIPLVRRLITDTAGRLRIIAAIDNNATERQLGVIPPAGSMNNVPSLVVQDVAQFEGQSTVELLAQILQELRISNLYLYELPSTLQRLLHDSSKAVGSFGNEPGELRQDNTLFAV